MKYESELISEILEMEGHKSSSLHYESECVEEWIESVRGAYPKVCDYEGEWINYYLNNGGIGVFPYETVSNVTEATIYHTVPIPFKSAILKGQTLVNLLDRNSMTASNLDYTFDNGVYTINSTKPWSKIVFTTNLVQNKKYFVMVSSSIPDAIIYCRNSSNEATKICTPGECPFIFTNPIDNIKNVSIEFPSAVTNGTVSQPMIIEYQEGMEKWSISYFEGMQSVQMPGLTTSNEDGTKTNILTVNEDVALGSNGSVYDELDLLTGKLTQRIDENGGVLSQVIVKTVGLTITNQEGVTVNRLNAMNETTHIKTNGTPINPFFTGEIPVEAIGQNLNSFIEQEGEQNE